MEAGFASMEEVPGEPPVPGLTLRREVDNLAVRFTSVLDRDDIGYVNVHDDLTRGGALSCLRGWAELREYFVEPRHRRQGIGTWLVREMAAWLRLGGSDRILASWDEELEPGALAFLQGCGWREVTRNRLRWRRPTSWDEVPAPTEGEWRCHVPGPEDSELPVAPR